MHLKLIILVIVLITVNCQIKSKYIHTNKEWYGSSEQIVVHWHDISQNYYNWFTVVKKNQPDDFKEIGQYFFTKTETYGEQVYQPLPMGDYEARMYFDWPEGGYNVVQRYPFKVDACPKGCTRCQGNQCLVANFGYYLKKDHTPRKCHISCAECSGPGENKCTLCPITSQDVRDGKCDEVPKKEQKHKPEKKCPIIYSECNFKGVGQNFCQTQDFKFRVYSIDIPEGFKKPVRIYSHKFKTVPYIEFKQSVTCIDYSQY